MFAKKIFEKDLIGPYRNDSNSNFRFSSYNKWALEEAFKFIDKHPELSTTEAIELFVATMDEYSCIAKSKEASFMFSTAKDYGEFLLDSFLFEFANNKEV